MRSSVLSATALLLSAVQLAKAQTFTDCNPLSSSTCPSDPALGSTLTSNFAAASSDWELATGTTIAYGANGAEFTIHGKSDAPTISSEKYIFFGKVDVTAKAAPGVGIVSSFILESDDLDEIDWEWLGADDLRVESNFFGKGNTTTYDRAIYHNVADPIGSWHTYTIDWTAESIKWSIDNNLVRTLLYGDALALGGKNYPQTPMKVKMGNWVGCADAAANQPSSPTYGTCQWAGGAANFDAGPFTMYVKSVTIQDYSCGSEYSFGDQSGSYQSIKVSGACNGNAGPPPVGASSSVPATSTTVASSTGGVFAQTSSSSSAASVSTSITSSSVVTSSTSQVTSSTSQATSSSTSQATSSSTSQATSSTSLPTSSTSLPTTSSTPTTISTVRSSASTAQTTASPTPSTSGTSAAAITSSSTTSSAFTQVTANAASTLEPKHKFGTLDGAVIALGLALGYLVM